MKIIILLKSNYNQKASSQENTGFNMLQTPFNPSAPICYYKHVACATLICKRGCIPLEGLLFYMNTKERG